MNDVKFSQQILKYQDKNIPEKQNYQISKSGFEPIVFEEIATADGERLLDWIDHHRYPMNFDLEIRGENGIQNFVLTNAIIGIVVIKSVIFSRMCA